jgi:UDP-N-acetylmuramate: L-alanyl-gamma-D-glutamyl-meso-diaminopimelate ligase
MGSRAVVADNVDALVKAVAAVAKGGDHLLCMSNGGFGGVHQKLFDALKPAA